MSGKIMRYQQPALVEQLAHQYVLGTQSLLVRQRIAKLRLEYPAIDERIYFWEQKLTVLHDKMPEIMPANDNWQTIQQRLAFAPKQNSAGVRFYQWLSGLSMACLALVFIVWWQTAPQDSLSYIAIMKDNLKQPQLVAATYGKSRTLKIELLSIPQVPQDMSLELWVRSKTDKQIRSLGVISTSSNVFDRQLSEAEWRLIKDSEDLLLTMEEKGGSPIGEPMGDLISQGLCIRMASWQDKV
ncbi:hypothetical protein tinsulaeT_16810 [Thalassotalea insulae]|uniref:Anti-sigma K factor RskA C-terminal domain-containing protein n=1 Tax=Thalassotalea insulae TaxID=2056778 RepID=A0ABQ6GR11_9GAMM|nr:anti-sigma factor [Thalassotalea insulae]GLX78341.1 hypothetical protein tinsulaeT_16810 [Thalassotalea insulae]